jgi:ribosomal protein S18 acetylase RimI-like enzyme
MVGDEPPLRVERLTPRRRDDYLRFFDHERGPAFADNPDWARCYCNFHEVPKAIAWRDLTAQQNRVAITARIDAGEMDGFVAYAGDDVVGWLNAQPRHKLPHCWDHLGIEPPAIDVPPQFAAAIVCFVVAPAWRGRGVAKALLDGALASFAARGIAVVDAFPFRNESAAPADHYHGPAALFRAAGFEPLGERGDMLLMRKRLASNSAHAGPP